MNRSPRTALVRVIHSDPAANESKATPTFRELEETVNEKVRAILLAPLREFPAFFRELP